MKIEIETENLARTINDLQSHLDAMRDTYNELSERIASIETRLKEWRRILAEFKEK